MATFVLVPAGWCGGWSWKKVAAILRDSGHEVHTPTLTGLGDRVHLAGMDISLEMHVTDVSNVITFEDLRNVILVGWSYGAIVITGVAARIPDRLSHLVYLDSVVPLHGQTFYEAAGNDGSMRKLYEERVEEAGTPGFLPFKSDGIEARVEDKSDREWMLERITPHPIATFDQSVRAVDPLARTLRRSYVRCVQGIEPDEEEPPFITRVRNDTAWTYHELDANHLAPISAPAETARLLLILV